MRNKQNLPLVSVIVPVYGTEKYVEQCLDSILNQTWQNIEVLAVNDASPGNAGEILSSYENIDNRVRTVDNIQNLGLFRARLEGAKRASGKYIIFIDSDDYVGIDYIRQLVEIAEKEQADIVKGQFVMDDRMQQEMYIYPYINYRPRLSLQGQDIADHYFAQEGLDFSWHIVCAKLYSTKLWRQCEPYYEKVQAHLVMTEDIAYSAPLFLFAQKYEETDADTYFYVQRKNASTGIERNLNKFEKNISDLKTAFEFRDLFLCETGNMEKYKKNNLAWKERYGRSWKNAIKWAGFSLSQRHHLESLVKEALQIKELGAITDEDNYFYSQSCAWSRREEDVRSAIADEKVTCVSFDLFDTLILRPFWKPSDLFRMLDYEYKKSDPYAMLDFAKARLEAEEQARKEIETSGIQEITLDDIYRHLQTDFGLEEHLLQELKEKENQLEIRYCYKRAFGYSLYELARFLGKKIVFASDMYLGEETILRILQKNGYTDYERLFLSCKLQKTKASGSLYHTVLSCYSKKELLHIGDNYRSDYEVPKALGIKSIHLPGAVSVFCGVYADQGYYAGNSYAYLMHPFGSFFDHKVSAEFWGIRCMLALAANKYFDNPYRAFMEKSDFNGDLYYIAYYALGMHLLGIVLDVYRKYGGIRMADKIHTIHFVARDGYGCKLIYDTLKSYVSQLPESNYFYLSRKALLPLAFQKPSDVFAIKDVISYDSIAKKTPRMVLEQFLGIQNDKELEEYLVQHTYQMDNPFQNMQAFQNFLKVLASKNNLLAKQQAYRIQAKEYMDTVFQENDLLFDIGYSGTSQKILNSLLKRPVAAYYVYVNKDRPYVYEAQTGCRVETFYSQTPCISGAVRELLFSKGEPSCCGYRFSPGQMQPVLEEDRRSYIEVSLNSIISQGILDFAQDFFSRFADCLEYVTFRSYDSSIPFEHLMERALDKDREIFQCCYFEDDIFLGDGKIGIASWWKDYSICQESNSTDIKINPGAAEIVVPAEYCLHSCKHWQRALALLCVNPGAFVRKTKNYLKQMAKGNK